MYIDFFHLAQTPRVDRLGKSDQAFVSHIIYYITKLDLPYLSHAPLVDDRRHRGHASIAHISQIEFPQHGTRRFAQTTGQDHHTLVSIIKIGI